MSEFKVGQIWETHPLGGGEVWTIRLLKVVQGVAVLPERLLYCRTHTPWVQKTMVSSDIQIRRWKLIADLDERGYPTLPRLPGDDAHFTHRRKHLEVSQVRSQMFDWTPDFSSQPISEYVDKVRHDLVKARQALDAMKAAGIWGERVEPAVGTLTAAIVYLYGIIQEMEKNQQ